MRLQDRYDWVVLGSHPGALLSAGLVARLGLSVLVLPVNSQGLELMSSRSGQYLDPETNYLIGLGGEGRVEGLISACLEKLGILPEEKKRIDVLGGVPYVVTSNNRLALYQNEDFHLEFHREFGKPFSKQFGMVSALNKTEYEFLSYWHNLPKRLSVTPTRKAPAHEAKTLREVRRKLVRSLGSHDSSLVPWLSQRKRISKFAELMGKPELMQARQGFWYAVSSHLTDDPSLFDLLHILNLSRSGASFQGGLTAYREFLLTVAKRHGAHVPLKMECKRIFIERGKFVGVQVANRGNMIAASGGVLGCSLERAISHMNFTGQSWWIPKKKPARPIGWKFTLALTVQKEAIPPTIQSRVIWQEQKAPPIEMEVVSPSVYGLSEPKHKILYLRTVLPFSKESLKSEYQRLISGRMLNQVMEVFPFLEAHISRIYPEFRSKSSQEALVLGGKPEAEEPTVTEESKKFESGDLSEVYGFSSLDEIPDNLRLYSHSGIRSTTGYEGLFIAAGESYPELGNLGPTIAALEAASWAAHHAGIAGPLS